MRAVHYVLLLRDQHHLYEAEAVAQAQAQAQAVAQGGLLAKLRAIFSQWKLFNREGITNDTEQATIDR